MEQLSTSRANTTNTITAIVYADCGPCRAPRRPPGLFRLVLPKLSINELNSGLERGRLSVLKAIVKEYMEIERNLPRMPGASYVFTPGLEDNYTDKAYKVLRTIAGQVFALRDDVRFSRNPYYPTTHRIKHDSKEIHTYERSRLKTLKIGDVASGDGEVLCFPNERCHGASFSDVRAWVNYGRLKGIITLIYRPDIQGIPTGTKGGTSVMVPPNRRTYKISDISYIKRLLKRT